MAADNRAPAVVEVSTILMAGRRPARSWSAVPFAITLPSLIMLRDDASWPGSARASDISLVLAHAVSRRVTPFGLVLDLPGPKHQSAGDGFALLARPT